MNDFKKSIILDFYRPSNSRFGHSFCSGLSNAAGCSELIFSDGFDDPITACLEAVLVLRDASRFPLYSGTEKKACWEDIWQIEHVADRLYAVTAL